VHALTRAVVFDVEVAGPVPARLEALSQEYRTFEELRLWVLATLRELQDRIAIFHRPPLIPQDARPFNLQ